MDTEVRTQPEAGPSALPDGAVQPETTSSEESRAGVSSADGNGSVPPVGAPAAPAQPQKGHRWLIVAAVVLILALLAIGIIPRIRQQRTLNQSSAAVEISHPLVNVVKPTLSPATGSITLPGTIEGLEQSAIDARATGYVSQVYVDLGSRVTAGQLLAKITSPDTDLQTSQGRAQLLQSEAALAQAQANLSSMQGALEQQQSNLGHARAAYQQAKAAVYQDYAQLAQAQHQYSEQQQTVAEQQANANLASVTSRRNEYLFNNGAIARQTLDQAEATNKVNQAGLSLDVSGLSASAANVKSYQENVTAGKANEAAAYQDIGLAHAEVATALANIRSAQAAVTAAQATVASNQAALERLVVLQGYENVTSPFAGVVTARNVDPGAYISAGSSPSSSASVGSTAAGTSVTGSAASGSSASGSSSAATSSSGTSASGSGGGSATGMFTVASIDRLRIYLNLPQMDADAVQVGQTAKVTARALPLKTFTGTVTRSAVALDPTSRTLVTEVQLANPGGVLRPGMFGQVKISVKRPERLMMIPDTAILTGASGPQVVIVGRNKKIRFQSVTIGQDNGKTMQILAGLKPTDRVVASPNYNLTPGEVVTVQKRSGNGKAGRGKGGG